MAARALEQFAVSIGQALSESAGVVRESPNDLEAIDLSLNRPCWGGRRNLLRGCRVVADVTSRKERQRQEYGDADSGHGSFRSQ